MKAVEDEDSFDIGAFVSGEDRYSLIVTGDSMVSAGILDGDTVIIRKQKNAKVGDIVVALIDEQEATLKRLGREAAGKLELVPENPYMQPMQYRSSRVSIQGVLVGQMRGY